MGNPLAASLSAALDPAKLAARVGITPDPWQAQVLRSRADRILLNVSRQAGKSTCAALMAVHTALYQPKSLSLVVSPSQNQSTELFRTALTIYRAIGKPIASESENKMRLELENGSRIVSLPGNPETVRGYSAVRLLLVDEAAQVSDELYQTIQPMLAVSGGRLCAMSTPFGRRGWWYQAWTSSEPWERYEFPASECPRISSEFLEQARREVGDWWYRQEYQCEFMDAATSVFGSEDIEKLFSEEVAPWNDL